MATTVSQSQDPRSPEDHRSHSPQSKKESSPTSFLPSLKSFDIETAKYNKNYNHQQAHPTDTSPSIDRLVLKGDDKMRASAPHTTAHSRSSSLSSAPGESNVGGNPLKSPLEPPHLDLLRALSLPSDKPWPYSEDTLNELIRLRIEQEKPSTPRSSMNWVRLCWSFFVKPSGTDFSAT
ncbi:hypothetical protein CJJ09_003846 [Candidozyma auris]|nr:hypothetical protein CJJ09_003846 [[Candida] auris]